MGFNDAGAKIPCVWLLDRDRDELPGLGEVMVDN